MLIGIALGLPAAWAASRWVKSMLFGLTPADPAAIVGAIVLLTAAAQLAAYLARAPRVAPRSAGCAAPRMRVGQPRTRRDAKRWR